MQVENTIVTSTMSKSDAKRHRDALRVLYSLQWLDLPIVPVYEGPSHVPFPKRNAIIAAIENWPPYAANGSPVLPDPRNAAYKKRYWEMLILEVKASIFMREFRRRSLEPFLSDQLYECAGQPALPDPFDDDITTENWALRLRLLHNEIEMHVASDNEQATLQPQH